MRRATRTLRKRLNYVIVSILALREKGDGGKVLRVAGRVPVSILALREKGDAQYQPDFADAPVSILALREKGDKP